MPRPDDLAALVGSRIAHDLASPIGAIGNGVELLQLTALPDSPELGLIADSLNHAANRIKLFRLAFGAAAPEVRVPLRDLHALLADRTGPRAPEVTWLAEGDPLRAEAKRVLLALMCLESAMPRGGRIAITQDARWHLDAESADFRLDAPLWDHLANPATPIAPTPAQVHFALLAATGPVSVTHGATRLQLTL